MKTLVSIVLALFLITIGTSTEASGDEDEYTIAAFTADFQKQIMVWTTTEIQEQIMTNKKRNAAIDIDQIQLNKDFASSGFNSLLGVSSLTEAEAKCGQNQTTSQSGGVSNADVLKSICALIASLSKQSYALNRLKERTLAQLTVLENELPKRVEAEAKAKLEAEAKAKLEAEAKAKLEAEAKAKLEAEAKAKLEAEAKAKLEAEAKAKLEAEAKAKLEAEAKAKLEAEAKAKLEAEANAAKKAKEKITITCKKGKTTKKVSGTNPKCPKGYKVKV